MLFAILFIISAVLTAASATGRQSFRTDHASILLTCLTALLIAMLAVILDQYPYGAAHQCLFLAPVVALTFGVTAAHFCQRLPDTRQNLCAVLIGLLTLGLGARSLQNQNPYGEVEDIKSILAYLDEHNAGERPVYAYPSSVYALKFYRVSGERLFFGTIYPQFDPAGFQRELGLAMQSGQGELWIMLTSVTPTVENNVIGHVPNGWALEKKAGAVKAALYLASRNHQSAEH